MWVTFVLVAYRWFIEQAVAATNTLTHAVLGFPVVASGLQRIIGVLFGGALLSGAGGVFGALLVIVGVLFAAGLFAAQVLLTLLLAVLIVAGPPLIALSAIPELSHLARTWAHALIAITLVPLGWTVLFATAGALCLDATSFTGGAGGVPGPRRGCFRRPHHVRDRGEAAADAARRAAPPVRSSELRRAGRVGGQQHDARCRACARRTCATAHGRTSRESPRSGASAGRAAGALGAPEGGPLGAARRGLAGAARRSGVLPLAAGAAGGGGVVGALSPGRAAGAKRAWRA